MDSLHIGVVGAWILLIIHERINAMIGIDLIALPIASFVVMMYGLYSYARKNEESTKKES